MSLLWEKIARPAMFGIDAERAHELGLSALRKGLAAPFYCDNSAIGPGPVELFGLGFPNPLGLAAGFDKNGVAVEELAKLGFGFVEVGTVTLHPQSGNPKPRLFRLPQDKALINRLGFNNDGAAAVAERLERIERKCIVGVNIGKNKDVPNDDAVANYVPCFEIVHPVADYIAINVSSPNTPGLRDLQHTEYLQRLLGELQERNAKLGGKPLVVKIAPDLTDDELRSVIDTCLRNHIDGVIATNTTTSRAGLRTDITTIGDGGLSGAPLKIRSDEVLSRTATYTDGKLPVIGVGGIFNGKDALEKLECGASLIQAYTGFVYGGPSFASKILREMTGPTCR